MRPRTCWDQLLCLPDWVAVAVAYLVLLVKWSLWAIVDSPAVGTGTTQRISEHLPFLAYCVEIGTWAFGTSHLVCRDLNRWLHPEAGLREKRLHRGPGLPQQVHTTDVYCGAHRQASGIQIPHRDQLSPCLQRKGAMAWRGTREASRIFSKNSPTLGQMWGIWIENLKDKLFRSRCHHPS